MIPLCIRRFLYALPVILATTAAHGRPGAEFLIIEHVDRLTVLNRYQQEATAVERGVLAPFAPIRILRRDFLLSDGYTRSMQVEAGGTILFLVMEQNGDLLRAGPAGALRIITRTVLLNDTIVVLKGDVLSLSPLDSPPRKLSAGERLVRFFRHEGVTYCATGGDSPRYGWVDTRGAAEGKSWRTLAGAAAAAPSITPGAEREIKERLAAVNRTLASLYRLFNAETGRREEPPRWELGEDPDGITCWLSGAPHGGLFRESTGYLAREIETIVLGSGVRVISGQDTIRLRVR